MMVEVCRWVRHAKRAVHTTAVVSNVLVSDGLRLLVALLTVVVRTEAVVDGNRAAEVALPVDLGSSVNLAGSLASAVRLELAVLAAEFLLSSSIFSAHLLATVNHATVVGLLAVVALVKGALVHCKIDKSFVEVSSETSLALKALVLGDLKCLLLDSLLECVELLELGTDDL